MNQSLTRHKWEPYLWLLPSLILMGIFLVYPIMIVFKLSFSEISRSGVVGGFNGLKNYITAVTAPEFGSVMVNTAIWVVSVVGISTLLGFIVALVLNTDFRGRKIARSIVVFPWAATLVVQASMWKYIINIEYGALNNTLLNTGIISQAVNWRPDYVVDFIWECGIGIFVTVPFVTFCVLAGLQSIDLSYYEAATVDGAGFWKKLRHLTLPLVRPSIYTITRGAPAHKTDTLVTYLYMLAFSEQRKGPATALSVVGFVILCICAGVYMIVTMRKEDE